jgi:ABC-type methionine transport system ATPase subunit
MKRRVKLTYPQDKIQDPLLFKMAKKYDIMPNIRRARVTDELGEIFLELQGKAGDLDKGMAFLRKQGVEVELIEGDVIE